MQIQFLTLLCVLGFFLPIIGAAEAIPTFFDLPHKDSLKAKNRINVIYQDWAHVRLQVLRSNKFKLQNDSENKGLNSLINTLNIKHAWDLSLPTKDFDQEKAKQRAMTFYKTEIPDFRSIHSYTFAKKNDMDRALEDLKKRPEVLSAFETEKFIIGEAHYNLPSAILATSQIKIKQTQSPSDPEFSLPESSHWWWFNRHRVFLAWNIYGTTPPPTIAILDDGFDTTSFAIDRPNYLVGYTVFCDDQNQCQAKTASAEDLLEEANGSTSHGTTVASVAASPANNGQGLSGIAPGANVLPIKLKNLDNDEIALGIQKAIQRNVDVISMSIQTSQMHPISTNPIVRTAISYATSAGIPVVIIAGNDKFVNLDQLSWPDAGEIIVGGTQNDLSVSPARSAAWDDEKIPDHIGGNGSGSGYGQRAHIAAASLNIWAPTYDSSFPQNPSAHKMIMTLGTSFAAPMVAATVGMMQKIARANGARWTPLELRDLVTYSGHYGRYRKGYTIGKEYKVIGKDLLSHPDVGIRELDVANAVWLAGFIQKHKLTTRLSNVDDFAWATFNGDWNHKFANETYGSDAIWFLDGLIRGMQLNLCSFNTGGPYTHGYQVFNYSSGRLNIWENMGGVQSVVGQNGGDTSVQNQLFSCYNYSY